MHGCSSGSALLVNAEVDSMGGVVDGGVGIGIKNSPRRVAIEKAQAELRQEYDVRESRRRELEFLEKGGDPLDYKFGNAASVSVQSTSLTDHHTEQFVTSEAKGSFALTASPHGDSVESSGRPGATTVCEPNSADNFDVENELHEVERKLKHANRRNKIVPSEQSSQMDGPQNPKESEDSAIFHSYARRNRSRPNRDGARSSSTDVVQSSGGHGSSLPVRGGSRDVKGLKSDASHQKDHVVPSVSIPKPTTSNGDVFSQIETSTAQSNMEVDGVQALEGAANLPKNSLPEDRLDSTELNLRDNESHQPVEGNPQTAPMDMASKEHDFAEGKERLTSAGPEASADAGKTVDKTCSEPPHGFDDLKREGNEGFDGTAAARSKGLDSESSCIPNNLSVDVNNDKNLCSSQTNDVINGISIKQTSEPEGAQILVPDEMDKKEKDDSKEMDSSTAINDDHNMVNQDHATSGSVLKNDEGIQRSVECRNEVKYPSKMEGIEPNEQVAVEADKNLGSLLNDVSVSNSENICPCGPHANTDIPIQEPPPSNLSEKNSSAVSDPQSCSGNQFQLVDKAREDSILEEARIIEAKHKRIAELSIGTIPSDNHRKSHWDFVLEEMAWLANDFAQERLWKLTAAAQICHRVALTTRLKVEERNQHSKLKRVAYTLAKSVMQFWHSAELLVNNEDKSIGLKNCKPNFGRLDRNDFPKDEELDKESHKESQNPGKSHAIEGYAVRFLKFNSAPVPSLQAEAPATPDRVADLGIMETSWDDHLTEESLFYAVPSGAMQTYRKSIESHVSQCEKASCSMQEEVDTSIYDATAEFGYHENAYDEEEGETSTFYLHGVFDGSKPAKHDQKRQKNLIKSSSARSYELAADFPYGHSPAVTQQNIIMVKRPSNNLHVGSFPTKRMRTSTVSRQRVVSPFSGAGTTGALQAPVKTDASSGDTSSFQDDQSTLHGSFQIQKSMEVESVADFERQLPYDCAETSTKPKKKKKAKHLGSAYEQGWQLDSNVNNEQRDNSKKRLQAHHFDSNGTSSLYGHHTKKPKILKQPLDNSFDNMAPMTGSLPSPAASQMSNMSNTNQVMKLINGRDRGRKAKSLKMCAGLPGSGSPWSTFEDQALVVLVHDMGPNWELVSDAINSTLQFKCIFRKPYECKERHKILMDKGAGDGADSADDSGSSQSYPSTLPGIPKGSARQLFQRLQGPMLEDTLKSHFEKIILIGKKQLYRRNQNDSQESKQLVAVHNSHVVALSQVCPNNLNGGVLTPLDLCDASASSPDVLTHGYQGSHNNGLPMSNQGAVASMLPTSATNSSLQGSPGLVLGNNSTSPSGPLNAPVRDGRYNVPRTSLPVDEQQRMQHYNPMLSNRNLQQPNMSNLSVSNALPGSDRGVRMLPGGNGMGMMPGMNRGMPLSRPGYPGMASSSMLSSGSMLSSNMVGMPSPVNMHPGTGSGQGNSMIRSREAMQMMRPGHNPEHQRQMMVPELQGNSQGISAFNGLSSAFANQTTAPPVQAYPGHPQQHQMSVQQSHVLSSPHHPHLQNPNHVAGSQQQAYAIRLAKERHMQQRLLQQQQQQQHQQLSASSALGPHVQPQSQLPTSSSIQNSTIQPQASSQQTTMPLAPNSPLTPMAVQQQKNNLQHHGINRTTPTPAIGLNNQMGKQRQRQTQQQQQQQFQQSGRQHPQQRQHAQSPQPGKLLKGMGRGNMVHQNLPTETSQLNGLSAPPGNQGVEKGEQMMHLMQGQGLYSGTGLSSIQSSKPLIPQSANHSQPQQKLFSGSTPPPLKQVQQMPSHSENSGQGQVHAVSSSHGLAATHQTVPSALIPSNHQHLQPQSQAHQKQVNQSHPTSQRLSQQNRQVNSDLPSKSQTDQGHVEHQPANNVPQMGSSTTAKPQVSCDSANMVPVVSSAVASQWKQSEPMYEAGVPNPVSQTGPIGSPSLTNSVGNDSVVPASQTLGPRQLSGGLTHHGHNAGAQWQPTQMQQSAIAPPVSEQQFQPQEPQQEHDRSPRQQLPLQQQSQQQAHLQSAHGSVYIRPTNSKLE